MTIRRIEQISEWCAVRDYWDRLAGARVFRRFDWAHAWWQAFGQADRDLFVLVLEDAGRIRAVAPLVRERSIVHGKQLALLGGGLACGDDLSLLVEPGWEETAVEELTAWLFEGEGRRTWDSLYWDGVSVADPTLALWRRALEAQGSLCAVRDDASRWAVDLPSDWDAYLAARGKSTRRLLRKATQRLTEPDVVVHAANDRESFELRWGQFVELHAKRWAEGGGGCFTSPAFAQFLRGAAEAWLADGTLRLRVLELHGQPAAAALGVEHAGVFSSYMFGRDPQFDEFRPGWMLSVRLIQEAIDAGLERFDFLRGDEPYKQRLGCEPIAQAKITVTSTGLVNRLRGISATLRAAASHPHR